MIHDEIDAERGQIIGNALNAFSRCAVNDAGFVRGGEFLNFAKFGEMKRGFALSSPRRTAAFDVANVKRQVFPGETGDKFRRIFQRQMFDDVSAHIRRCRCRERGDDRAFFKAGKCVPEAQIIRAEIVPPLRKAVCFVHGKKRNVHPADGIDKAFGAKTFRRDINEFERSRADFGKNFVLLLRALHAV